MGAATLRLGMAKDGVLSQLGPEYRLVDYGSGSFGVSRRALTPGGDFDSLGFFGFADIK
jgi:hypothetical protein